MNEFHNESLLEGEVSLADGYGGINFGLSETPDVRVESVKGVNYTLSLKFGRF